MGLRFDFSKRVRAMLGPALLASIALAACRPNPQNGAHLKIEAPAEDMDADVYVDGHYVGQLATLDAAGTDGIRLAPGVHRLEIRKAGRFPVQRTLKVPSRQTAPVVVTADLLEDPR